jgi:hypothetical protein
MDLVGTVVMLAIIFTGVYMFAVSQAATPFVAAEVESGTVTTHDTILVSTNIKTV